MKNLIMPALMLARRIAQRDGESGRQEVYGAGVTDISTKSDLAISKAVLVYFRKSGIEAVFLDEEMIKERGPIHLTDNPKYTIAFDDLDGTDNYYRSDDLPVVSIVTIFDGLEPRFQDAVAAGIIDIRNGNVWYAERGKGAQFNGILCETSGREVLDRKTLVCLDHYGSEDPAKHFARLYAHAWVKDFGTAGYHFANVAGGKAPIGTTGKFDAFLNLKNKSHESGAGYLLVKEAGGWVADLQGNPIDEREFDFNEKHPVIAAATEILGRKTLEFVDV
ncbi:MAG TPA: inositol monophosphatase family protein [archaeon]|nr:inositol monophosphatase family protein [archaeon]